MLRGAAAASFLAMLVYYVAVLQPSVVRRLEGEEGGVTPGPGRSRSAGETSSSKDAGVSW